MTNKSSKSSLYPEILFHFTDRDGLWGILKTEFSPSYAHEKIVGPSRSTEFGAPMVSFCDLKLSEIKVHMAKYKGYGIGLSKKWANKNGLNPVFYMSKDSPITDQLIHGVETFYTSLESMDPSEIPGATEAYMNILNMYRYIKNYQGELERKDGTVDPDYRYADEREWRYVVPLDENDWPFAGTGLSLDGAGWPFVPVDKIKTSEQKKQLNEKSNFKKLGFEPDDIQYLVVQNDNERIELIDHLYDVKSRFAHDIKRRLASRILTAEQIYNDF